MRTSRRSAALFLALGAFLLSAASASATLAVVADESDAGHRILQIQGTGGEDPSVRIEGSDITINNSAGSNSTAVRPTAARTRTTSR